MTNRDKSFKAASIYLLYCGSLCFFDKCAERQSLGEMLSKNPVVNYYLRSHSPEKENNLTITTPE